MFTQYLNQRRINRLRQHKDATIADFYDVPALPFKQRIVDCKIVSLDLETGGLNPEKDPILSMALIEIERGAILSETLRYNFVKQDFNYTDAMLVHGVSAAETHNGEPLQDVIKIILEHCKGAVLLAHNVSSDWSFLRQAIQYLYHANFVVPVIDTLLIERRKLERRDQVIKRNSLTLAGCRKNYGLPEFAEHDPRNDALATAELLLAQMSKMGPLQSLTLADLQAKWMH